MASQLLKLAKVVHRPAIQSRRQTLSFRRGGILDASNYFREVAQPSGVEPQSQRVGAGRPRPIGTEASFVDPTNPESGYRLEADASGGC